MLLALSYLRYLGEIPGRLWFTRKWQKCSSFHRAGWGALNCMWGWETWVYVFEHPSIEQAHPTPGRCISVACKCIINVSLSCVNGDRLSFNAPITKSSFIRDNQGQKWAALHSKWTKATVTMLHNTRKKTCCLKHHELRVSTFTITCLPVEMKSLFLKEFQNLSLMHDNCSFSCFCFRCHVIFIRNI